MIKYSKLPDNIIQLLTKVERYLKDRSDVSFAYLFGSLAKGEFRPLSDVDIAIFLSPGVEKEVMEKKMEILGDLMELLETDEIDLVILNTAPLSLAGRILESRKVIADNDPFVRHKYESLTMREYFDFSRKEMDILKRRYSLG